MESREEPLTKRERAELQGYVSWPAVASRAVLFVLAVAAVGGLSWRLQQWLPLSAPLWLSEGPIVFVLTDGGETLVFRGQDLSRDVARGFPWREFEIRESARSHRFLRLKRLGEPLRPSATKPPLSPEQFKQLGLGSVARWKQLDVSFGQLRKVA